MFSPVIYLMLHSLFFTLRLSGGGGSFPRPLKPEEEKRYLERCAAGDLEARNVLVEHNLRLVAHIVKKYYAQTGDQDDLISIGTIGLIKGISTFKADKNVRLATYASRCIENELRMHFRRLRRGGTMVSLQETLEAGKEDTTLTFSDVLQDSFCMEENCERQEEAARLRQLIEGLPARERKLILLRYGMAGQPPLTQLETAQLLQISRSYVSRLETHALEQLRKAWHS